MPITADRIARLREFGLSEYAARSYLALLDLGTTEARDVSALSKVPASKIYHILEQLHEKGLVNILPEFPRKYAPVPFAEYLQRLQAEHDSAARAIERDQEALTRMFAVVGGATGGDRGSVTLLRGRRNVHERILEGLRGARREILVLVSQGMSQTPGPFHEALDEAAARGVRVRTMGGTGPGPSRDRPEALPTSAFAYVIDGTNALLGHAVPDDGHPSEGNDTALFLDQEGIVQLVAGLLGAQWDLAPEPSRALRLVSDDPRRLPASPGPDRRA